MGEPSIESLHDQYEDQLSAARYKAERDAAVQELQAMRERNLELWMESGMANELVTCAEQKAERLGKLVWRLQNRLARSHRREKALRKGMRMWREKVIGAPVRTVSAYDLLPQEERDAIAWVRENGGLESVKERLDWVVGHCSTKQQLDFDFWLSGRVMHELGFEEDMADRDEVEGRLLARIMPEGYEWPRWDDNEPITYTDSPEDVCGIFFALDASCYALMRDVPDDALETGERVKRPAVPAADGEPLVAGQMVYHIESGDEFTVTGVDAKSGDANLRWGYDFEAKTGSCAAELLTHRAPVLAADGKPLREGEHVYHVETGAELVVKGLPKPGEYQAVVVFALPTSPASHLTSFDPDQLTHERPVMDADGVRIDLGDDLYSVEGGLKLHVSNIDKANCRIATSAMFALDKWADPSIFTHTKPEPPDSWERIEEDLGDEMAKQQCGPISPELACKLAGEFVRRCQALAERGE